METRNFPEKPVFGQKPEIVHYDSEKTHEVESDKGLPTQNRPIAETQPSFMASPSLQKSAPSFGMPEANQPDGEVEKIMKIAAEKGVEAAVREVRKDEPAVIDAVHDKLVEELSNTE